MPVKTKAQLQAEAALIANETTKRANTATRVGNTILDVVDTMGNFVDVTSYGVLTTNTGAVNDTAIAAAIAAAQAAAADLWWPAGTYPSAASLASLHSVRHRGPGAISRGSNTFYLDPKQTQTNNLYCSAAGSAANDGLTSSEPTTLPTTATYLGNYGPMLDGTWKVNLAAGTYLPAAQTTIDGLQSRNPIQYLGPAVAYATPTAIVDGTGATGGACGLYFRNQVRALVRDIKFQSWSTTDAMGVVGDRHCELQCDNVHTTGNDLAGINAESHTRLYVTGGTHANNNYYNIRAYGQCLVTIGYNSSSNRLTIGDALHAGGSGILVRDNSSGHIDYCDINGVHDGGGVELINQSRVHLVSCVFGGSSANYYNVKVSTQSTFIDDGTNTFNAATAKSIVMFGFSIDSDANQLVYYDDATGYIRFGLTSDLSPLAQWHHKVSAVSGISYNGNVDHVLEKNGNPYFAFGGSATGSAGHMYAKSTDNRVGQFDYNFGNNTFLMRAGAVDAFKWFSGDGAPGGYYRPEVQGANAPSLGDISHPWISSHVTTRVYMTGVFDAYGTGLPNGNLIAAVGSTYRRAVNGAATGTFFVKESGSGATGWIAK